MENECKKKKQMLGPAAHVLEEQMAEADTELIRRLHAFNREKKNVIMLRHAQY